MKKRTRNILIILAVILLSILGVVGYGIYSIYSLFAGREVPDEIKVARVLKGEGIFVKSEFFKLKKSSFLETAKEGQKIKDEKEREKLIDSEVAKGIYNFSDLMAYRGEVIAVGEFGGFVLDAHGDVKQRILFEPVKFDISIGPFNKTSYRSDLDNLKIIHLTPDRIGFLSEGSIQGVRIFDENGNQIWNFGAIDPFEKNDQNSEESEKSVLGAAVGDLNNDGTSEYIVAMENDGIRAFDNSGKLIWFYPEEFPYREITVTDLDGDGRNEVVQIGEKVLDGQTGKLLYELNARSGDCSVFAPGEDGKVNIRYIDITEGKLFYSDENGETLFETEAPLSAIKKNSQRKDIPGNATVVDLNEVDENAHCRKAILVKVTTNEPEYLAVVASYIGLPRSNLYIFDPKGILVFHELLPEEAETIGVMPSENGLDDIVVGGKDTIWRYSKKSENGS